MIGSILGRSDEEVGFRSLNVRLNSKQDVKLPVFRLLGNKR